MDNSPFEARLRNELRDAVENLEAAPLPGNATGRMRLRQVLAIAAVIAFAVVIAGTTVAVLSRAGDRGSDLATTPDAVQDPRGSGGTYPCHHPDLDGACVAHGEYDGTEWWIGARMEGDELCTSDVQEERTGLGGSGMGCGPHDPDKIGFGVSSSEEDPNGIASGEVADDVARLVLERGSGPAIELELYPAPPDFPLDVRFYNVFLPEDARTLVAYDAQGNEVARQDAEIGDFRLPPPDVVRPRAEIASGEIEGHPWSFTVREELTNGDVTACTQVMFGRQDAFGGGGSCNIGVPDERPLGFSQSSFESGPRVIAIFGTVDAAATEVLVELESEDTYEADVFEAPDGFRSDVAYYIAWVPMSERPNPPGRVVALDPEGNEVGREDLCGEIASDGGTCGN